MPSFWALAGARHATIQALSHPLPERARIQAFLCAHGMEPGPAGRAVEDIAAGGTARIHLHPDTDAPGLVLDARRLGLRLVVA